MRRAFKVTFGVDGFSLRLCSFLSSFSPLWHLKRPLLRGLAVLFTLSRGFAVAANKCDFHAGMNCPNTLKNE